MENIENHVSSKNSLKPIENSVLVNKMHPITEEEIQNTDSIVKKNAIKIQNDKRSVGGVHQATELYDKLQKNELNIPSDESIKNSSKKYFHLYLMLMMLLL